MGLEAERCSCSHGGPLPSPIILQACDSSHSYAVLSGGGSCMVIVLASELLGSVGGTWASTCNGIVLPQLNTFML
jgi:hypothetical protein